MSRRDSGSKLRIWHATAMIIASTVGAGVIGIPYAIAEVGVLFGIAYILGLGLLMLHMNLMIGEVATRTNEDLQLVGLAKKYLGYGGKTFMTIVMYGGLLGALVAYIIGVGEGLAALLPGTKLLWSSVFFGIGLIAIYLGIKAIKKTEILLTAAIVVIVGIIAAISVPEGSISNLTYLLPLNLFAPYGVIMFSLHSSTSIPEAHQLLKKKPQQFKKAITIASVVSITIYIIFAIAVVGVSGVNTTEVATVGLGKEIGNIMHIFGNVFAVLTMGTSFFMLGLSLRDSIRWDFRVPLPIATILTCGVPFAIVLLGLREFISAVNLVGGIFVSLEMILVIMIYWHMQHKLKHHPTKFIAKHNHILIGILLLAIVVGMTYSVVQIIR